MTKTQFFRVVVGEEIYPTTGPQALAPDLPLSWWWKIKTEWQRWQFVLPTIDNGEWIRLVEQEMQAQMNEEIKKIIEQGILQGLSFSPILIQETDEEDQ